MRSSCLQSKSCYPTLIPKTKSNPSIRTVQSSHQHQFSSSTDTAASAPPANEPPSPASSIPIPALRSIPPQLPHQPSAARYSSAQSAPALAKASGCANPAADLSAAQTQNTSRSGAGERGICPLLADSVSASGKVIAGYRAVVGESVLQRGKSSRRLTAMLRMRGRLKVVAEA